MRDFGSGASGWRGWKRGVTRRWVDCPGARPTSRVTWQSELEEDVRQFELMRRTPNSNDQFVRVFEAPSHGPNLVYMFRDSQVFKSGSEKLDYQLEAVYMNGVREVLRTESVNYTSTAVRRTWGSLKAMFQ